jgi:hypothetical protein
VHSASCTIAWSRWHAASTRRLLRSCRPPARSGGRWRDRQRRWRPRRRWSTQLKRPSRGLDTTSQQPSSPCWRITRVDVLAAA